MTFLPIVERELRLKGRGSKMYFERCALAFIAAVVSFSIIPIGLGAGRNPAQAGHDVFWVFAAIAFALCAMAGPVVTADCLSEEKREGTLGLLFLTDLRGYDVVLGKLVATSLPVSYSLIAAGPMLALPLLYGGVTAGELRRMAALLLATLFLSVALSMLVSTLSRNGRRAFVVSLAVNLLLIGAPLANSMRVSRPSTTLSAILATLPSPGSLFLNVNDSRYAIPGARFWFPLLVIWLVSIGVLIIACVLVPHTWKDRGANTGWFGRSLNRWLEPIIPSQSRRRRRLRILEGNPVIWLQARTTLNRWLAQAFLLVALAVWLSGYNALRKQLAPPLTVFAIVYALHALVKCWVAWEASRRFAEDRRNGALELLLTTPLDERSILAGWLLGLKRHFLWPTLTLLALDLHLWWASESSEWLLAMLATVGLFAADCYTLCWIGLWMGLNTRTSNQAFVKTIGRVLVLPWFVVLGLVGVWNLLGGARKYDPSLAAIGAGWFVACYVMDFALCAWAIHKLSDDFRSAAARQFEPPASNKVSIPLKPVVTWSFARRTGKYD